jgi:hypothetical protein
VELKRRNQKTGAKTARLWQSDSPGKGKTMTMTGMGNATMSGFESRPWREVRLMMFDDSMEHEACNSSSKLRVVLLFDVWRPELSDKESC